MKDKLMKRWRYLLPSLFLLVGSLVIVACGPKAGTAELNASCESTNDCLEGLICSNGKCKKAIVPPAAKKPIANAGQDFYVKVGEKVTLDGSESVSLEGKKLTYIWTLKVPKGSKVKLTDADKEKASFTPDKAGTYVASLVVDDGQKSEEDSAQIVVVPDNHAPKADAGVDQLVELGTTVKLDASKSSDPDGDKLSYSWKILAKPQGSTASIKDDAAEKTEFTPDKIGLYGLQLVVSDGSLEDNATIAIRVVVNNPKPVIDKLTPGWAPINVARFKINIAGKNFLFGAVVKFDGKEAAKLQYDSPTSLTAWFDFSSTSAGKYDIVVINPDKKESNKASIELKDVKGPEITKVSPSLLITGQSIRLEVEGVNFIEGAVVSFDGKDLKTTYISDSKLSANLEKVPVPKEYDLVVTNPDKKKSTPFKVLVSGVQAILLDLSHDKIGNNCAHETLTVKGRNFMKNLNVELVSKKDQKRYSADKIEVKSTSELRADFDFTKIPVGDYDLIVTNDGVAPSLPLPLKVTPPPGPLSIITYYPRRILLGDKGTVYLVGLNFDKSTQVSLNGQLSPAKKINDTTFAIPVDASKVTKPGKLAFSLTASCKRKSKPIEVEVAEVGTPKLYSLLPLQMYVGKVVDLQLQGADFGLNVKVFINGKETKKFTRKNSSLIIVEKSLFVTEGKYKIYVQNKNGQKSNELLLEVLKMFPLKLTDVTLESWGSLYLVGKGIQKATAPGKGIKPRVFFYDKNGKETCQKGGLEASDSYRTDNIYISSFIYSCKTSPLKKGEIYKVQVVKDDGKQKFLSNPYLWTYGGGSSGSTTDVAPYLTYLNPASINISKKPKTIAFRIYGSNIGKDSSPAEFFVDGVKVDKKTDTNFQLYYGFGYVKLTISTPKAGQHSIELQTKAGKSNTLFFNLDATDVVRLKSAGSTEQLIFVSPTSSNYYAYFYLFGDNLDKSKQKMFINGKVFTKGSFYGSSPYKMYTRLTKDEFNSLPLGEIKVHVEDKAGKVKSNSLTYRIIDSNGWGKVEFSVKSLVSAAYYVGDKGTPKIGYLGFIPEDKKTKKKGAILLNGKEYTDYSPSSSYGSCYAYLKMKEMTFDKEGTYAVALKNPDGTLSKNQFILSVRPKNSLLLEGFSSTAHCFSNIIRINEKTEISVSAQGFTKNTLVHLAHRTFPSIKHSTTSFYVNFNGAGLQPGYYPLWLSDPKNGVSNTIIVQVRHPKDNGLPPKFYGFSPVALQGSQALPAGIKGKVRFALYGEGLTKGLLFAVDKKTYPITLLSEKRGIAEVDISSLAKGEYDVYLTNKSGSYVSPKLKLSVQ